jgi:hypothetical protein
MITCPTCQYTGAASLFGACLDDIDDGHVYDLVCPECSHGLDVKIILDFRFEVMRAY